MLNAREHGHHIPHRSTLSAEGLHSVPWPPGTLHCLERYENTQSGNKLDNVTQIESKSITEKNINVIGFKPGA